MLLCERVAEAPPMASVSGDCVAVSGREAFMRSDEVGERARDNAEASRGAIDCRARGNLGLCGDRHGATLELAMRSSVVVGGRGHA